MTDDEMRPCWWLPTLGFFIFLTVNLGLFSKTNQIFADPSVGRHLLMGERFVETGQIPRTDSLSYTHAGAPLLDYEWAFEATLGLLYRLGGLGLVAAFCVSLSATTALVLFRTLLRAHLPLHVVLLYTLIAVVTLRLHYSARPLLFTYLFFALVIEVWRGRRQPLRRDYLLLPLVFATWANLHAGWAAALVFLGLSWVGRLIDRLRGRAEGTAQPLIPWAWLIGLCALATCLNPYGLYLHRAIFLYATTYKSFALWNEYAIPDFDQPSLAALVVLFLLAATLFGRVLNQAPRWSWETYLPFFFFLYSGLKAQRHVLLLVEVAAVPVARDLAALTVTRAFPFLRERHALFMARQRSAGGDAWLALLVTLVIGLIFVASHRAQHLQVGPSMTPPLLTFLREHPDRFTHPLTSTWNAGPLLWNLRPNFRVAFDDRGDFYGDKEVFAFVDLYNGRPGWRETLARSHATSALLEPGLELNQLLPTVPGWHEVYRTPQVIVYWVK